jgi:glucose/arabinose dehydrogenase
MRARRAVPPLLACALLAAGCGGPSASARVESSPSAAGTSAGRSATSTGAWTTPVGVPEGLGAAPFDRPRTLTVPAPWKASVYARVPKARFLLALPDGGLLVSQPSQNRVLRVPAGGGPPAEYVGGLDRPHDMVLATIGGRRWLYVSAADEVVRYPYADGAARAGEPQVMVDGLPDDSLPELGGRYGHVLKNIAVAGDTLYVSIASTCNACVSDTRSDPVRGAIYRYDASGHNAGRALVARGIRNAEGLAFAPGTDQLWAVVNNRDNILVPSGPHRGERVTSYVDDHPPEAFIAVAQGGFYGWPFCHANPDNGLRNMPYDPDYELNRGGSAADCARATPVDVGIQAHSAPLGLTFVPGLGAVVALHGSWNRSRPTGYKVILFPWGGSGPAEQRDLVTGFRSGSAQPWGRPVDVAVDATGALLVSDDLAGAVYRLERPR